MKHTHDILAIPIPTKVWNKEDIDSPFKSNQIPAIANTNAK